MNILQLVPKLNVGGVEKGTVEVARYLTLNGHKAVVVSGGGMFEKDLAAIGARHYTLPVGRKNPFIMVYCYLKLRRIIEKENIQIVHARSRIPALTGYFAARSAHRKFITTAHGQYKKHLISKVMGWGKTVIVANETMARYMKENFNVPFQKLAVIPRGVDLRTYSFIPGSERKNKIFRVGMVCRFTQLKGHLDFLKAASYVSRRMNNAEIILMGDRGSAKKEYIKKIELTIRRLMLENVVKFVDSTEDVATVLKDLDVLVSANRSQEAFGRSVIEAQARGTCVVATRVGGVVENIEDGITGLLCEPMDPSDMAEKILRYAEDPDLAERISVSAAKYVQDNYSLDKMMEKTLDIYTKALEKKNILIFKISSLGDIILSTPSLRVLRKKFPGANIKVLVDVNFRDVLENCPYVDEVITCDLKRRDRGAGFLRLAGSLRAEDFDITIDLQNSRKSHMLAFLSAAAERYGYDNGKWSFFINRKISLPGKPMQPVDHQACVLGLLGITSMEKDLELWEGEESDKWARTFLEDRWLKKGQKLVALSLSASRKWKTKNLGISGLVELTEMLAKQCGIRVVLIGAEQDRADAVEFIKKTGAKPIDAVGKTSISQLISLIKRCNALVTGDSAPMHIAAAVRVPFVAYFGPTDPSRHMPPAGEYRIIHKDIKCSPCYKPLCHNKIRCMKTIKPEEIFDALMELMEKGCVEDSVD